jgi:YidC/Oxa1 family membrane protein insertase
MQRYKNYQGSGGGKPTALVAPTWGPDNALAHGGESIVTGLLAAGLRVIVRPHPAFFESIYTDGKRVVEHLERTFGNADDVSFENSITSEQSYMEADLMVSDWSGAAFEFALGTERPVLFIDVPPKVNNAGWVDAPLEPFESLMRTRVGAVVQPDADEVATSARTLLASQDDYKSALAVLRDEVVYNVGGSAQVGGRILAELVKG